jgi:hypothetical protein
MKNISRFVISVFLVIGVLIVESSTSSSQTALNNVCVNKKTGSMRYLLKNSKQVCNKTEVKLIWNQSGATGATGATGVAGATGATGATGVAGTNGTNGVNATVVITQQSVCDGIDDGSVADELCKIGMTGPGGGLIFFVDYNDQYSGFNYLEAAPATCGQASTRWSSVDSEVTAASGWATGAVGQGQANTTAILAVFTTDTTLNNAAKYADSLVCGTKTDWFLGSIGEMMLMFTNLRLAGVGDFSTELYWSSSDYEDDQAWILQFGYGNPNQNVKYGQNHVRPVRAF